MPVESSSIPDDIGGALVLGAGFGRRFGSDKRRHLIDGANPMLLKTLSIYSEVFEHVAIVLREEDEELGREVELTLPGIRIIRAEDAHLGMGHSLAAGVRSIHEDWRYVCIGLADMPFVRAETLVVLRSAFLDGPSDGIVQPVYEGRPGHPVIFGERYFEEMARLKGDAGARAVIQAHSARLEKVPLDDPGVIQDIDLPPSSA